MSLTDQTFIAFPQFRFRVLKTGKETGGAYDLIEHVVFPKARTVMRHCHKNFSEKYTVISGMMILEVGSDYKLLMPGDTYLVEANKLHTFFNHTSDDVRFTTEIRPASEPFIKALVIRQGLIKDGLCNKKGFPKKLSHSIVLLNLSQTYVRGLGGLLMKAFVTRAKKPKMKKLETELIKKYYEPYL